MNRLDDAAEHATASQIHVDWPARAARRRRRMVRHGAPAAPAPRELLDVVGRCQHAADASGFGVRRVAPVRAALRARIAAPTS